MMPPGVSMLLANPLWYLTSPEVSTPCLCIQLVEQGNERLAAFQGEALLTHVAGVQVFLEPLGGREQAQYPALVVVFQFRSGAVGLEPLLDPAFLRGVGDVHVFRAHGAGVDLLQQVDDFAQGHALGGEKRAGVEGSVEILFGEVVVGEAQFRQGIDFGQAQRVEIGVLVAAHPVGIDQPQHGSLFGGGLCGQGILAPGSDSGLFAGQAPKVVLDLAVGGLLAGVAVHARQAFEQLLPLPGHASGILQPRLVEAFYERGVSVEERRGAA